MNIETIQRTVADHHGLLFDDMRSEGRHMRVARPRQVAMYFSRQMTKRSLPEIGRQFGGRDHTTVLHACRKVEQLRKDDREFARELDFIQQRLMSQRLPTSGFNLVSLGDWLALARKVNVPYVAAHFVADALVDDLKAADLQDCPERATRLQEFFTAVYGVKMKRQMMRWDCCAPEGIKLAMIKGAQASVPPHIITLDEPRIRDAMDELPPSQKKLAVWRRPWIDARIEGNFPVEYRVFVESGRVLGVSNYYPQRAMRVTETVHYELRLATLYAQAMLAAAPMPLVNPQIDAAGLDNMLFSGTLDFIATTDKLLFLEGGPPSLAQWGAHACCFEGRPISGTALGPLPKVAS